ncbi:2-pyrone-4,6-dicarboxylate hydrolase [Bordetella sp. H567]|uniref:amidohydrolase family protein n=1 Tax=Bordetella sp. H567 TaxID=1697043 RepID=UPI00081C92D5|nr:amidohydrolase family protein [Bordetella sp. H567]AOB31260.1 2-pyrone-4,6-dicarboxylate hydrolase [Bordetella sp. H567]
MKSVPPPHPHPSKPAYALPPGSCDAHVHVYGPVARFPYAADRAYDPPEAPIERLQALHHLLGVERAVIVQATVHGTDNRAMLDAIARAPDRYRGVALVARDVSAGELRQLHAQGVRGVRYNFMPHLGKSADPDEVRAVAERIAPLGWHVQVHVTAAHLPAIRGFLESLPVPFVIDHMGRPMVEDGLEQPALAALLDVLRHGRAWVKISGPERISARLSAQAQPYADAAPFVRRILDAAPDRTVWGTDWPHPNVREIPDDGKLVELLPRYTDDAAVLQRVLVENPARLYWYD